MSVHEFFTFRVYYEDLYSILADFHYFCLLLHLTAKQYLLSSIKQLLSLVNLELLKYNHHYYTKNEITNSFLNIFAVRYPALGIDIFKKFMTKVLLLQFSFYLSLFLEQIRWMLLSIHNEHTKLLS